MPEHILYKTGDEDAPYAIKDRNGEVVLALCRICNGAEASMPTQCPGVKMTPEQKDEVQAGTLDFDEGCWLTPA
jgi:hypothetical protein